MQKADIGYAVDDDLAIQLQQQAQHAVGAGVLGTHVQQHGLAGHSPVGDQMAKLINCYFTNIRHSCDLGF